MTWQIVARWRPLLADILAADVDFHDLIRQAIADLFFPSLKHYVPIAGDLDPGEVCRLSTRSVATLQRGRDVCFAINLDVLFCISALAWCTYRRHLENFEPKLVKDGPDVRLFVNSVFFFRGQCIDHSASAVGDECSSSLCRGLVGSWNQNSAVLATSGLHCVRIHTEQAAQCLTDYCISAGSAADGRYRLKSTNTADYVLQVMTH